MKMPLKDFIKNEKKRVLVWSHDSHHQYCFLSLPVCVQALSTPAPDRSVHLQDFTVSAMTMDEQMSNNPRKHNRGGWQLRQGKENL